MKRILCLLAAAGTALAGCGDTTTERTLSGAGLGAGAGAAIGAVAGASILPLAIAGAAVGGVAGAITDKSQVNLGNESTTSPDSTAQTQPADNKAANVQPAAGPQERAVQVQSLQQQAYAPADSETIRQIQMGLAKLGYDPGAADGVAGTKTRSAIRAFQQEAGMPANGVPSQEVARRINQQIAVRGQ